MSSIPVLSMIAAMDKNRVIGIGNRLPWHLPEDLRRFKAATLGKPVVMGRNTYESIGHPLPGRRNMILSRNRDFYAEGCESYCSLDAAIMASMDSPEILIIGGDSVYRQALPRAQRLYLTLIDAEFDGDAWFPEYPLAEWRLIDEDKRPAGGVFKYPYRFITLVRN